MIWVIGCKGMLGRELCRTLESSGIAYTGTDMDVDILNPETLKLKAEEILPDWIVNCSAYTAVDRAEEDADRAYAVNRDGAANIAGIARELDVPLIHISTDYVFDGTSSEPLTEGAQTGPIGIYGASKLAGEESIRDIWARHYIIRTAWLYGEFGSNFVYTMIKLMNKLESIKVVNDQIGSPTWTKDLSSLIQFISQSRGNNFGTYHFSGEGRCSWFDFAEEIYRGGREAGLIKSACRVNPCGSGEFPTPAKRPDYSLLSKDKVRRTFDIPIPSWKDSLKRFLDGITDEQIK